MKIMNNSISKVSVTFLVFLLTYQITMVDLVMAQTDQSRVKQGGERQAGEAERVWKLAIETKGGREKLYSIRTVLIRSGASAGALRIKIRPNGTIPAKEKAASPIQQEELYVLPDKYWLWNDLRPSVFGLNISMYNFETGLSYWVTPDDISHAHDQIPANMTREDTVLEGILGLLLETKWLKPTLVAVRNGRVAGRNADVVETRINQKRYDFAFDKDTHLLLSDAYVRSVGKLVLTTTRYFSDYVDLDGIKMAQHIRITDDYDKSSADYTYSYTFNIEYNNDIFLKPPPIEAGPEAWRKTK